MARWRRACRDPPGEARGAAVGIHRAVAAAVGGHRGARPGVRRHRDRSAGDWPLAADDQPRGHRTGRRRPLGPGAGAEARGILDALVEPTAPGDPESPLRWTCLSTRTLAVALEADRPRRESHRGRRVAARPRLSPARERQGQGRAPASRPGRAVSLHRAGWSRRPPRWTGQNRQFIDRAKPSFSGGGSRLVSSTARPDRDASRCGPWCASSGART